MKKISHIKHIYFAGIGGIGMSALARYFLSKGVAVSGYDRTQSELTDALQSEGAAIVFSVDAAVPPEIDLVVYTPALSENHPLLTALRSMGLPLHKRSEVLGWISEELKTIAVAGAHGKTTVSAMIAHILTHAGMGCNAFLGGIALNYNSNYIGGQGSVAVMEADEFDRSFLQLHPSLAVVTSVDTDHLDVYGSRAAIESVFEEFVGLLPETGTLVVHHGLALTGKYDGSMITYSLSDNQADLFVEELKMDSSGSYFRTNQSSRMFHLAWPGKHNVENALAALGIASALDIEEQMSAEALSNFAGIYRRFEYIIRTDKMVFIDDYAHHPNEIKALLTAVRELYPNKRLTAVFQPHLYSRTRDLAPEFGKALAMADELILLDIYPAREQPIEGVDSSLIANQTDTKVHLINKMQAPDLVASLKPELLISIGAGDIDRLVPILAEKLSTAAGLTKPNAGNTQKPVDKSKK